MIEALNSLRPTALPALLFLAWLPLFLLLPARHARSLLVLASFATLVVVGGPALAGGLAAALVAGYFLAERAARLHRGRQAALITGFIALSLVYWACFFLPLPDAFTRTGLRPCDQAGVFILFSGVGYSFFRLISYFGDRMRGTAAGLTLADYLAAMLWFPQFGHGPIERPDAFAPQLRAAREGWSSGHLMTGIARLGLGVAGLVLLSGLQSAWQRLLPNRLHADLFAQLGAVDELTPGQVLLLLHMPGVLLYVMESSYASLALGVSRTFGVRGSENFDFPFLAPDPRAVWHRWNITLSRWLRDQVYIPLGGNVRRKYLNVAVVFVYCGLIHGLQWRCLAWGVWAGVTLAVYLWLRDRLAPRKKDTARSTTPLPSGEGVGGEFRPQSSTLNPQPSLVRTGARAVLQALGRLLTFHWFCIGVTIIIDPDRCGLGVLRRYMMMIGQALGL